MKRYISISALLALICAQDTTIIEELYSDAVQLPVAYSSESTSVGTMGEYKVKKKNKEGDILEQVWFYVSWRTGDAGWQNGYWIQNYWQAEDHMSPGKYLSFTCNAKYNTWQDKAYSWNIIIETFFGDSIRFADTGNGLRYDQLGDLLDDETFVKTSSLGLGYTTEYSNRRSYQACTGISLLYEAMNDLPVGNSTRNDDYLYKIKSNAAHKIEHGFRVWSS